MPTPDQCRIVEDRAAPRLLQLWWALRPLTSVVRFMQTGAHPDDETSGLLAALALRDGLTVSYACSRRSKRHRYRRRQRPWRTAHARNGTRL